MTAATALISAVLPFTTALSTALAPAAHAQSRGIDALHGRVAQTTSPAGAVSRGGPLLFEIPRVLAGQDIIVVERIARVLPRSTAELFPGRVLDRRVLRRLDRGYRIALDWRGPYRNAETAAAFSDASAGSFGSSEVARTEAQPLRSSLRDVRTFKDRVELDVEHVFADRTVTIHWSLLSRPKVPMRPRFADWRVPYFTAEAPEELTAEASAAASSLNRPAPNQLIRRFRLEKKDPAAAVSDVVAPIVFYLDPTMPKRWVPWVKRGVEFWQPAFEAIGFRNAIVAREAPSRAADPTWSFEDGTHSAIKFIPDESENASGGPEASDDATGESLTGTVAIAGGMESLMQRVGFALLGGNPDVPLPFPDSLMGALLSMVTAHEVGHALGFPHNFRGSASYPTDSARSKTFIRRMGYSASLMDYAYFNFLAQPEDSLPLAYRYNHIGPYDLFALRWGYQPIPDATTAAAELPTLERWRTAQDTAAYLRAGSSVMVLGQEPADPGDRPDDIGADLVKSAEAATKNFARAGGRLVALRSKVPASLPSDDPSMVDAAGERRWTPPLDLEMISSYQNEVLHRWNLALVHAASVVGGVVPKAPYATVEDSQAFVAIDSAQQVTALRFVLDHVFRGKDELVQTQFASTHAPITDAESLIMRDSLPNGWELESFRQKQSQILRVLLEGGRLERLAGQASRTGVLPIFCTEMDRLRRELAPAIARARQSGTKQVDSLENLSAQLEQIESALTGSQGVCQSHGWTPAP